MLRIVVQGHTTILCVLLSKTHNQQPLYALLTATKVGVSRFLALEIGGSITGRSV